MSEVRQFVRALQERLAREQAAELAKLANNQFKSGKEAKHIAGRCGGLARASQVAVELMQQWAMQDDGSPLPEMPQAGRR